MSKELKILNFLCLLIALAFLALAVWSALSSGDFFTTDNLFIIVVSLLMALLFAINPLLYLKSENRLPIPFMKRSIEAPAGSGEWGAIRSSAPPPLLDAKGRAVPPDVRAIVSRLVNHPRRIKPLCLCVSVVKIHHRVSRQRQRCRITFLTCHTLTLVLTAPARCC